MKRFILFGLISIISMSPVAIYSCEKENGNEDPGDPVDISMEIYQKEVIDSANSFAFNMFLNILTDSKGTENILISPFSISSALSMTLNGADGQTYEDMRSTLGMSTKTMEEINQTYLKLMSEMVPVDERVTMEIANSVWVEKRLTANEPFITALQTWYLAELFDIDVTDAGAVEMVNNWIAEKTHDKITDMLDYLNPDLAMLLINAIYFNGKWRYRFDEAETKQEPFYYTPDATVNVSMMNQTANLKVVTTGEATIAEIPYGQGNYNMIVVLPADNLTTEEIVGSLTPARWEEWMDQLSWNTHEVELKMPKFKYGYKRVLNDDLIDLGMEAAFSEAADFSNISDQDLFISRVIHQTFIENDEQGTEAAAATVVEICFSSADPSPMVYEVHLDHPFLYFIRESSTGTILFMGRVNDPTIN